MVLQPEEPKISLSGINHFARSASEFESSEGISLFPELRIISTITREVEPEGDGDEDPTGNIISVQDCCLPLLHSMIMLEDLSFAKKHGFLSWYRIQQGKLRCISLVYLLFSGLIEICLEMVVSLGHYLHVNNPKSLFVLSLHLESLVSVLQTQVLISDLKEEFCLHGIFYGSWALLYFTFVSAYLFGLFFTSQFKSLWYLKRSCITWIHVR